jgi:hypothetical protein
MCIETTICPHAVYRHYAQPYRHIISFIQYKTPTKRKFDGPTARRTRVSHNTHFKAQSSGHKQRNPVAGIQVGSGVETGAGITKGSGCVKRLG